MNTFGMIKAGDLFKNSLACLFTHPELLQADQFLFDHVMKRCGVRAVVTVAFAAHAAFHFAGLQMRLVSRDPSGGVRFRQVAAGGRLDPNFE